jgi:hypothetical protein
MTSGTVTFKSLTDANLNGLGDLNANGEFTVRTIFGNKKLTGLVPGTYQVTIVPPQGADQTARAIKMPDTYEVKPDGPDDFSLTVPGKSK